MIACRRSSAVVRMRLSICLLFRKAWIVCSKALFRLTCTCVMTACPTKMPRTVAAAAVRLEFKVDIGACFLQIHIFGDFT